MKQVYTVKIFAPDGSPHSAVEIPRNAVERFAMEKRTNLATAAAWLAYFDIAAQS